MRQLLLVFACLLPSSSGLAETRVGQVVSIVDGDTLVLQVERRRHQVRLVGIDAPERVQSFGAHARANLGRLAFQRQATADCPPRAAVGPSPCKVLVAGQDIGLRQLADGMAWRDAGTQTPEDAAAYQQAEMLAKLRRLGLWSEAHPTPPWNWRKLLR